MVNLLSVLIPYIFNNNIDINEKIIESPLENPESSYDLSANWDKNLEFIDNVDTTGWGFGSTRYTIETDLNGHYYCIYKDRMAFGDTDILIRNSSDLVAWSNSRVIINENNAFDSDMDFDDSDNMVVAYKYYTGSDDVLRSKNSSDYGQTFGSQEDIYSTAVAQHGLTYDDSYFYSLFKTTSSIRITRSKDVGYTWSSALEVDNVGGSWPSLAFTDDGKTHVTYHNSGLWYSNSSIWNSSYNTYVKLFESDVDVIHESDMCSINGSILAIVFIGENNSQDDLYWAYSKDSGYTWSKAEKIPNTTNYWNPGISYDTTRDELLIVAVDKTTSNPWKIKILTANFTSEDTTGPSIGAPIFSGSIMSNKPLTLNSTITDPSGVLNATLYYGYSNPYNQNGVAGTNTVGDTWHFTIPAQGDGNEENTFGFFIEAYDNDTTPESTINNNGGGFYLVSVTDDDTTGPIIGAPSFTGSILSDENILVWSIITDAEGVENATLYYGYSGPLYDDYTIDGTPFGSNYTFIIPAQGDSNESNTLSFSIIAYDTDNSPASTLNNNGGSYFSVSITDDDTIGPSINSVGFNPSVLSNETLSVICNITDSSGISSARLYYGYSFPYNQYNIDGTNIGDPYWEFIIPAQGDGNESEMFSFYVVAYDNDNSQASTTDDNGGVYYDVIVNDDDTIGPFIGVPTFDNTVKSNETLNITCSLIDYSDIENATLYYGYSAPYNQNSVSGVNIVGNVYRYVIPAQGVLNENQQLSFYIEAYDKDNSPAITINNNSGEYFNISITDITPPQAISILIESGKIYTFKTQVNLTLNAGDASEMKFKNEDGGWSIWQPYQTSIIWDLSGGYGVKVVYVVFRDQTLNEADPINSTIIRIKPADNFFDSSGNNIIDLIDSLDLYMEIDAKDLGFLEIYREKDVFANTDDPSDNLIILYYYSFEVYDKNYELDSDIINSALIRIYYDPKDIKNLNNLQLLKFVEGNWITIDITINTKDNYIEFTTSTFSVYLLCESKSLIQQPMFIIIIIIIIGSAITISGSVYSVKKKSKAKSKQQSLDKKKALMKRDMLAGTDLKSKAMPEIGIIPKKPAKAKKAKKAGKADIEEEIERRELTAEEKLELEKTEAEVDVEKKSFTCIVHRGEIVGNVYICPNCQSFYCHKCAKVLKIKGEKCWSCENEITVSLTEEERITLMEKKSSEILKEIIESDPVLKRAMEAEEGFKGIPELYNKEFTLLSPKELDTVDLLDMSIEEKTEFIKEILNLNLEERKQLLNDMLKNE